MYRTDRNWTHRTVFFFPRPEPEVPERKPEQVRRVTNTTTNWSKEFFGTFSFEFRYFHPIISLSPNHFHVNHPRTPHSSDPRLRCILCFSFDFTFLSVFWTKNKWNHATTPREFPDTNICCCHERSSQNWSGNRNLQNCLLIVSLIQSFYITHSICEIDKPCLIQTFYNIYKLTISTLTITINIINNVYLLIVDDDGEVISLFISNVLPETQKTQKPHCNHVWEWAISDMTRRQVCCRNPRKYCYEKGLWGEAAKVVL